MLLGLTQHSVVEVEAAGVFADFGRRQRAEGHKHFERKRLTGDVGILFCKDGCVCGS